jgi:uncharacterized protein
MSAMAACPLSREARPEKLFLCGRMLVEGRSVVCNLKTARAWFTRAAEAGMSDAKVALAEMMLNFC